MFFPVTPPSAEAIPKSISNSYAHSVVAPYIRYLRSLLSYQHAWYTPHHVFSGLKIESTSDLRGGAAIWCYLFTVERCPNRTTERCYRHTSQNRRIGSSSLYSRCESVFGETFRVHYEFTVRIGFHNTEWLSFTMFYRSLTPTVDKTGMELSMGQISFGCQLVDLFRDFAVLLSSRNSVCHASFYGFDGFVRLLYAGGVLILKPSRILI